MSAGDPRPPPPDLHVAQQSRRGKLRVQPAPNPLDPIADLLRVPDVVRVSAAAMSNSSSMMNFPGEWAAPPPPLVASSQGYYHHQQLKPRFAEYNDGSGELHFANQNQELASVAGTGGGSAGPLGPFTGYAMILKSSKFSRPAQLLMEEFCSVIRGTAGSERLFRASSGGGCETADGDSGGGEACKVQQKKATLIYLQEEVCRKYKHYHQQMQTVVSSFDSVSGLTSAAPYTSSALESVSKHFRNLKITISDQLQLVSKVLGEELISSPISSRGENTTNTQMKYLDQSLRKQKGGDKSSPGFTCHPRPVWRPQRGLPERAVSVLRSWLFEHFLHPYPSDMDKHMLASQTGLSRNQVSNWFINARVRLWKPMVEEIHMLESKGMSSMDLNTSSQDRNADPAKDDGQRWRPSVDQTTLGCDEVSQNLEPWHCDKRLRTTEDFSGISPVAMDVDLASFSAYHHQHQHAVDIAGIGAVSLSLGLRHEGGDGGGLQDSQQMGHFGTTMLRDFVR